MNISMRIRREVALESDRDEVYEAAKRLGEQGLGLKRSQITGLESVANGTQKVSDVLDYVKRQTARHKEWSVIGPALLTYIEETVRKKREAIVQRLKDANPKIDDYQQQEIAIQLVRALIAQIAAQYEYASMLSRKDARDD